jgi:hypothetical protein
VPLAVVLLVSSSSLGLLQPTTLNATLKANAKLEYFLHAISNLRNEPCMHVPPHMDTRSIAEVVREEPRHAAHRVKVFRSVLRTDRTVMFMLLAKRRRECA